MLGLLTFLVLGLLIAWMGGVVAVHRTLTHPPRRTYASAVSRGRAGDPGELEPPRRFEAWEFSSRGLSLPAWDLAGDDPAGPVAILSHGWGDSRIGALQRLPLLLPSVSRVIAWDMPGHGDAPGTSTLGACEVEDLRALIEHLHEPHRGIVLFGWSLGAGVSIAAAAALAGAANAPRVALVIAEAPYRLPATPARAMLRAMRWPAVGLVPPALWLASVRAPVLRSPGRFDRAAAAGGLLCPLLVLHGERDEICPVEDGRSIAVAAGAVQPESRIEVFPGAFHNDLWQEPGRVMRARRLIEGYRGGP